MSEAQFTRLVTTYAQDRHPGLRPDAAFAKLFGADDPEAVLLRKAHAVIKNTVVYIGDVLGTEAMDRMGIPVRFAPVEVVGGDAAWRLGDGGETDADGDGDTDEQDRAYGELDELADVEMRRDPSLSKAQAFTKAYLAHPELAARERKASRRKLWA